MRRFDVIGDWIDLSARSKIDCCILMPRASTHFSSSFRSSPC